ncbi:DUF6179 domain-containing protein (plasmid) [Haloimpatiens sp. FM7330]|uniref:DUF6179 domain-containing protein n=1 Tax=Haloimpatiens sp. FM7330 TaxID=3298610 RepID=UPI003639FA0E
MGKDNNIQKYNYSMENAFSDEGFFKGILVICYKEKLLDDNILSKIYYERMELLKVKLKYYTRDESSSVMVEIAENILQCIDYTIGIYLKTFNNIKLITEELKNTSLSHILKMGHDLIKEKILGCKKLLKEINKNKLKVDNYSYNDTIDYGIPLFFKEYNDFFASHESPGSIDYQLYLHIDDIKYVGIEYINKYLETLNLENDFCNNFEISEITKLLKGYDNKCEVLLINIFELVLTNSLGRILCGKDLNSLNISNLDRKQIKNKLKKLSLKELQEELLKNAQICWEVLDIENPSLITYVKKSTFKITSLINESIKLDKLETVFISFNEKNENNIIEYTDGKKMSNSKFKNLSEKIRDCSLVEDKIKLIKNNIKSLEDLVDMLNADCLFENEYIIYFKSLSRMEIILLSKYISENEYEKDLYSKFNKYILSLSKEEQLAISNLKEKIQL